ncbi:hypothetical protein ACI3KS_14425 [Microbacterium sp. ZW T5_45]|uniref:hypothetical protein n=1 Tax=Microbacterium sp. ZW T5_45 TaxID=3378080 RepID=UPI0038537AA7
MRMLLLGARGAVGRVVRRDLEKRGHLVTATSRSETEDVQVDLGGDLSALAGLAGGFDAVINASGIERADVAVAVGETPFIEISATGAYLEALRLTASGGVLLGAGLAPGLSTVLASSVANGVDDVDVLIMLGSGERHGPAAVAWTAGLVGTDLYRPAEGGSVRNLRESLRAPGPNGRVRRYLRADFPDHVLLNAPVRSYLALGSSPMTAALDLVGRMPALRGLLTSAPHFGSDAWHVVARNRRTEERREVSGQGQSEATGRLTALATERLVESGTTDAVTMADLITPEECTAVLRPVSGLSVTPASDPPGL